jgi:hypothetical protein
MIVQVRESKASLASLETASIRSSNLTTCTIKIIPTLAGNEVPRD